MKKRMTFGAISVVVALLLGANELDADVATAGALASSRLSPGTMVTEPNLLTPSKGGPGAACSVLSLNARLHSAMCNPRLRTNTVVVSKCQKQAVGAGLVAAGAAAVATTQVDWPGILTLGAFTYGGTEIWCQIVGP